MYNSQLHTFANPSAALRKRLIVERITLENGKQKACWSHFPHYNSGIYDGLKILNEHYRLLKSQRPSADKLSAPSIQALIPSC